MWSTAIACECLRSGQVSHEIGRANVRIAMQRSRLPNPSLPGGSRRIGNAVDSLGLGRDAGGPKQSSYSPRRYLDDELGREADLVHDQSTW